MIIKHLDDLLCLETLSQYNFFISHYQVEEVIGKEKTTEKQETYIQNKRDNNKILNDINIIPAIIPFSLLRGNPLEGIKRCQLKSIIIDLQGFRG
jgi:hypothetical protein